MSRLKVTAKIDVLKIDKTALYRGKKGTYLDIALVEKPGGEYGDDGFVAQSLPRDRRDAGERGPIIGNWRYIKAEAAPAPEPAGAEAADDLAF